LGTAIANVKVRVKKVGVYSADIEIVDELTGNKVELRTKDYSKRTRQAVERAAIADAHRMAKNYFYENITVVKAV
jgi:hypothetical protein